MDRRTTPPLSRMWTGSLVRSTPHGAPSARARSRRRARAARRGHILDWQRGQIAGSGVLDRRHANDVNRAVPLERAQGVRQPRAVSVDTALRSKSSRDARAAASPPRHGGEVPGRRDPAPEETAQLRQRSAGFIPPHDAVQPTRGSAPGPRVVTRPETQSSSR